MIMEVNILETSTDHVVTISVIVGSQQMEKWEDSLDEFIQENLHDLGVYELDPWDDHRCLIQVIDDTDEYTQEEIRENFELVVDKVKSYLNTEK